MPYCDYYSQSAPALVLSYFLCLFNNRHKWPGGQVDIIVFTLALWRTVNAVEISYLVAVDRDDSTPFVNEILFQLKRC